MSVYGDESVNELDDVSLSFVRPGIADEGGLGSLADELAGAFGDDYSEEEGEDGDEEDGEGHDDDAEGDDAEGVGVGGGGGEEVDGVTSDGEVAEDDTAERPRSNHSHSSNAEEPLQEGISHGLAEKIAAIEKLAIWQRHTLREEDLADGGVIKLLMSGLQELGSQSVLESGSMRLITAHSALSSNMLLQTRTLRELGFSINAVSLPPPETTEIMLGLPELIPLPNVEPLAELSMLHHLTLSLATQLSTISDTLHMARQSSTVARRKLQAAKEACADWRNELEMVETARRWIEDGDWDAKCKRRDAAVVCRDVTSGFEDVCRGFEEKLRAQEDAA